MVGGAGQRGHGGLRRALGRQCGGWPSPAGSSTRATPSNPQVLGKQYNEAASQDMARTDCAQVCRRDHLCGWAAASTASPKPRFILSARAAAPKRFGRWTTTGRTSMQVTHLGTISLSPRISPDNYAHRLCIAGPRRMGHPDVLAGTGPAGELSRRARPAAATSLRPGRATGRRSPSRRRARATRRSGWRMPAGPICAS